MCARRLIQPYCCFRLLLPFSELLLCVQRGWPSPRRPHLECSNRVPQLPKFHLHVHLHGNEKVWERHSAHLVRDTLAMRQRDKQVIAHLHSTIVHFLPPFINIASLHYLHNGSSEMGLYATAIPSGPRELSLPSRWPRRPEFVREMPCPPFGPGLISEKRRRNRNAG
ncbi:hypothetical protein CALCODRAFT_315051 [Calocera cornea HHB12733]|uniref:Secreted protein n=1 Tax=Calocera cornea HHB12733 TaxID=1353952 RepID=A0A165FC84_9BASI|nr:hypothetical protein CALCODRAFT_315051 [Calocera cornea HHB12733]